VRLENSFDVAASPKRAWALLNDVPRVVPCLPGAELTRIVDENTWQVLVQVKLGPIALQFQTDVTRDLVDEARQVLSLAVKAREARGRGGATATIESSLTGANGRTRVSLVTELALQGAVAQYGRGIVGSVADQLTSQFAACLAALLEQEDEPAEAPVRPVGGLGLMVRALWSALLRPFRRR
jgi:carbon monoxide dehydrogenase subunit G